MLPKQILLNQGSLWGISPKTAKKTITVNLEQVDEGTRVRVSSKLSSDWKNITLIGCAFALVLVGLCIWMATDLTTVMATHQNSFWSWLVAVEGNVDLVAAQAFVNLTWGSGGFSFRNNNSGSCNRSLCPFQNRCVCRRSLEPIKLGVSYLFAAFLTVRSVGFVV